MNTIYLRNWSAAICDIFEDLLDRYGIDIPDDDREGNEGEAHIYGMTYAELEEDVTDILNNLIIESRENTEVNTTEYHF